MNTSKNKLATLILLIFATLFFFSCSKDDDSPINTSNKVIFKAETSSGSLINMIVYGYDTTLTTISNVNSQSWTSPEITVPSNANVASIMVNAMGASASSSLKVQVYVNGTLEKEGTSTGTALSATAQYNLK